MVQPEEKVNIRMSKIMTPATVRNPQAETVGRSTTEAKVRMPVRV